MRQPTHSRLCKQALRAAAECDTSAPLRTRQGACARRLRQALQASIAQLICICLRPFRVFLTTCTVLLQYCELNKALLLKPLMCDPM